LTRTHAAAFTLEPVSAVAETSPERAWWLRAVLVFQAPAAVFAALRTKDERDVDARAEPLVAIGMLAGIASVLWSGPAGTFLDDPGGGITTVAAWAVFGGAIYGAAVIWAGGLLLHLVARRLGSLGSYQRARQIVGFSLAPLALSLLTIWPVRLVLYGDDVFREGGADSGAAGAHALLWLWIASGIWSLALLLVGVRAVHGWTWARAVGAVALTLALPALVVGASLL
jgi:hypothetical protein